MTRIFSRAERVLKINVFYMRSDSDILLYFATLVLLEKTSDSNILLYFATLVLLEKTSDSNILLYFATLVELETNIRF